jgi:hypothetical protein
MSAMVVDNLPSLVRLIEAEDMLDVVVLARIGDVLKPARDTPVLVGVEHRDVLQARESLAVDDCFPIVHPCDLGGPREVAGPLRASLAVVLLWEGKATLAIATCARMNRRRIHDASESRQG